MERKYVVYLWPFAGYCLIPFEVEAYSVEQAIDLAVVQAEKDYPRCLLEVEDVEDVEDVEECADLYLYVDATLDGANRPYYVDAQNLKIEEI